MTVSAPARLHLGLLGLDGGFGRRFGGLGVAVDAPRTEVTVTAAGRDDVTGVAPDLARRLGSAETAGTAARLTEVVVRHRLAGLPAPRAARVLLTEGPAAHTGFGRGTLLALAAGTALAHAAGFALDAAVLARAFTRDLRSGIGLAAFESGGLVVDGGQPIGEPDLETGGGPAGLPPVIARHAVPDAWRFVVVLPEGERGLRLAAGRAAAERGYERRSEVVGEICRRVLMELLPALLEGDLATFGRSLTLLNRLAAEATASGPRPGPIAMATVAALADLGAVGAGQSALGPACYGIVESETAASALVTKLSAWLSARDARATVLVAAPDNQGARVSATRADGRASRRP